MKPTQRKDTLRNIGKRKGSYLSIVIIALMGVTAFLGICYSAAAMKRNGSAIYNEQRYRNVEVISTRLLSAEDMDVLRSVEGVLDVEPLYQTSNVNAYKGNEREIAKMADRVVKVRGGKIASIKKNLHPVHAQELVW